MSRTSHAIAYGASMLRPASLLALVGLLAACSDRPSPSSPDRSPAKAPEQPSSIIIIPGLIPKQIAFGAQTDAGLQVYRVNPNGSSLVQVTQSGGSMPAWSPDRTKIAFSRAIGGVFTLMVMNVDGTGLAQQFGPGYYARWSPDGTKLAFQRHVNGGAPQVFVVNADGTGEEQLADHLGGSYLPTWSPEGNKIAYAAPPVGGGGGQSEIWVMNANGSNEHPVTDCAAIGYKCTSPDWHPTVGDNRLVYSVSPYGGVSASQIRTIRTNGTDDTLVRVVGSFAPTKFPVWSPDGTKIAYLDRPPHAAEPEIFIMNANGGALQRVTYMPTTPKQGHDW